MDVSELLVLSGKVISEVLSLPSCTIKKIFGSKTSLGPGGQEERVKNT
jgi:hypothetical protein